MKSIGGLPASDWQRELRENTEPIRTRFQALYGKDPDILSSRRDLYRKAIDTFIQSYGPKRDVLIFRAPGRINLLGNHVDHRGGYVNYIAINRESLLVASPRKDDRVELRNFNATRFAPRSFSIHDLLPPDRRGNWLHYIENIDLTPGDWSNYIQAAVLYLQDQFPDQKLNGMDIAVTGDIPIAAGLSSSSSLVVSALEAALTFNHLSIPQQEKAEFCGNAEWYVGTRGGSGDHAAMLYAKRQAIVPLHFFPLTIDEVPLPDGYRVVACNSFVEHAPPGIFNERVATYEIGLMLVKQQFPEHADRLGHLRDLNADNLGISLADMYRILKGLPEWMSRDQIRDQLPDQANRLETLFAPHPEPESGYRVRQVVLFGLAECARSALGGRLLKTGDIEAFGRLKSLSHDGDRQFTFSRDGQKAPVDNRVSDTDLDTLIEDVESEDADRIGAAQIHLQPGGYDCSCEELDLLVDLANRVDGVGGAGLAGGGLGGCVLVVVREDAVNALIHTLNQDFYKPRDLPNGILVCASVAGSGIV
ncbi:MAG: hypothetical protein O7G87_23220 [bacterium]|nr:hypothetical protein [bacterium]